MDASYGDLNLDLSVDASLPQPQAAAAAAGAGVRKNLYCQAGRYAFQDCQGVLWQCERVPKIFEANKDQLSSPDRIDVGEELNIP